MARPLITPCSYRFVVEKGNMVGNKDGANSSYKNVLFGPLSASFILGQCLPGGNATREVLDRSYGLN
jgi:hypothetical protein